MSAADYFTKTALVAQTLARASAVNTNLTAIEAAFGRLPDKVITDTGRITFAVTGGAADVYTLSLHKTPASYYNGMALDIEVHATNTGACTINVDSLGAKSIKIMNGTDPAAGDLTAGDYLTLRYDDTNGYFVTTSTVRSIINGQAAMSDAEIKTAYENNANTNAFTDEQQTKVNYLTVTGAVDLDAVAPFALTANETVAAGDPLALRSDGKVEAVQRSGADKSTASEFIAAANNRCPVVRISDTTFAVVFSDNGGAGAGKIKIGTFDPSDISSGVTWSSAVTFESGSCESLSVTMIRDNVVLVAYEDIGNTNYGTACAIRVDGALAIPGTPAVFKSATTERIDCAGISPGRAAIFSGGLDEVVICEEDDLALTFGTAAAVNVTTGTEVGVCKVTTDVFFLSFLDSTGSNRHYGQVGRALGNAITLGTSTLLEAVAGDNCNCAQVADGKVVATMEDANTGYVTLCTVDGLTITQGTTATTGSTGADVAASDETIVLGNRNGSSPFGLECDTLSISGVAATAVESVSLDSGTGYSGAEIATDYLGNGIFVVTGVETSSNGGNAVLVEARPSNYLAFAGFASNAGDADDDITLIVRGKRTTDQSGLTAGLPYYISKDGDLTTEATAVSAGIALSATSLLSQ